MVIGGDMDFMNMIISTVCDYCQEDKIFRIWRYRAQLLVLPPKEVPHEL